MNTPSLCVRVAALAAIALLFAPVPAFAGPEKGAGYRSFPELRLKAPQRGQAAVDQLSTRLPEVARAYGLNSAELHRMPLADPTFTPASGLAGITQFTFDAASSYDPDGSVVAYAWDFGDGTGATGALVAKIYPSPGQYAVTVTVTDESGLTHSAGGTVAVAAPNLAPVAEALASLTAGVAPVTVTFDGSGSSDPDGSIVGYAWSFGDGTTASGPVISQTYSVAGISKAGFTYNSSNNLVTAVTLSTSWLTQAR